MRKSTKVRRSLAAAGKIGGLVFFGAILAYNLLVSLWAQSSITADVITGWSALVFVGSLVFALVDGLPLPVLSRRPRKGARTVHSRRSGREMLISGLARLAGVVAGHRRAHLPEAWAADDYDPETCELLPASRRLRLAAGDVVAALRCRLDDAAMLAWRPVDALLGSWHGSRAAMMMPLSVAVGLVLRHERFYGLIANAENLGAIAAASWAAIKALRKYRRIDTPKRPEKKTSSADRS